MSQTCRGIIIALLIAICVVVPYGAYARGKSGSGDFVLCTNWGDDTLSLVNIKDGHQVSVIKVGPKPYDIKVDAAGRYAYVSMSGASYVSVIDIQANLEAYKIPVGQGPREIDLSEDGKRAVVANSGDDSISLIDLEKRTEIGRASVGNVPYGIGFANDDKQAVVSNWAEGSVSIVDLASLKELKKFSVGSLPYTVMVSQQTGIALITNFGANQASIIDLRNMTLGQPIRLGRSPWGGSVTADGKLAVVCNFYSGELSFLSISRAVSTSSGGPRSAGSNSFLAAGPVNSAPIVSEMYRVQVRQNPELPGLHAELVKGMVAAPEGRAKNSVLSNDGLIAVASDLANNELMIVDVPGHRMLRTIPVGKAPYGIAFIKH